MGTLPLAAMDRVMREIGAERVSDSAKEALREVLEAHVRDVSKKSVQFARHANRNTLLKEDISLAKK